LIGFFQKTLAASAAARQAQWRRDSSHKGNRAKSMFFWPRRNMLVINNALLARQPDQWPKAMQERVSDSRKSLFLTN
jgi:hypothetical protein